MADDRKAAIERWVADGLATAREASHYPTVVYLAAGRPPGPRPFDEKEGPEEHVRVLFRQLVSTHEYASAWLVLGHRPIAGSDAPEAADAAVVALAERAREGNRGLVEMIDRAGGPAVSFASPVLGSSGQAVGAVVLLTPASTWLFPLLRREPLPSRTVETLLIGGEGADRVFLSPPRLADGDARRRVRAVGMATTSRFQGGSGAGELEDYRGQRALAAVRSITGTSWDLVTKVDLAEALQEGRRDAAWAAALAALAFIAFLGLAYAFWERQAGERRHELMRAQARAYLALEKINEAILFLSPDGHIVDARGGVRPLYGVPAEALLGRNVADLWPADLRPRISLDLARVRAARSLRYESTCLRADGTRVPVEVSAQLLEGEGQSGFVALVHDIRPRKATEAALLRSEEQYGVLFARGPVPAFVFDLETYAILDANEAAVDQYGYTLREILSSTLRDILPPEGAADILDLLGRDAPKVGRYSGTWKHRRKDGSSFDVAVYTYAIQFRGRPARLALALDVSGRAAKEERRRNEAAAVSDP